MGKISTSDATWNILNGLLYLLSTNLESSELSIQKVHLNRRGFGPTCQLRDTSSQK